MVGEGIGFLLIYRSYQTACVSELSELLTLASLLVFGLFQTMFFFSFPVISGVRPFSKLARVVLQ